MRGWDDQVLAKRGDSGLDRWFSDFPGFEIFLVQMPESTNRKVCSKYAVNSEFVSFSDGMPYLIVGQESLNDLNSRLGSPDLMNRFRPNLVFNGGEAFLEDSWEKVKIGGVRF